MQLDQQLLDNPWTTTPDPYAAQQVGGATSGTDPWGGANLGLPPTPAPTPAPASGAPPTYSTDLGAPPTPATPTNGTPSAPPAPDYASLVQGITTAPDPQTSAVAQDGLARQLTSDLQADGHDVAWDSNQTLTVDGRAYELAGAPTVNHIGAALNEDGDPTVTPPEPMPGPAPEPTPGPTPTPAPAGPIPSVGPGTGPTVTGRSPDQIFADFIAKNPTPTSGSIDQLLQVLHNAGINATRATHAGGLPSDDKIQLPDGSIVDLIQDVGGPGARWMWSTGGGGAGTTGGDTMSEADALAYLTDYATKAWGHAPTKDDLAALEHDLGYTPGAPIAKSALPAIQKWVDAHGKTSNTKDTNPGLTSGLPPGLANWQPGAPQYLPNFISPDTDIPGFADTLALLSQPLDSETQTAALVKNILEHPESLSDKDIEMLKAKNAEELAVAGRNQDEELQHFGYNTGLDTSPWLAGQRANTAWGTRAATAAGNRNVDMTAAQTNAADRRAAAGVGTTFASYQTNRRNAAVNMALESAVQKAAEQRGRVSLNESLKQAATSLGLTRDQLTLSYISTNLDYLTKNKSIDNDFAINMKKLQEQSDEFKADLAQRIAQLKQQDEQFRAQYGLDAQRLQEILRQGSWDRQRQLLGV